MLFHVNIIDSNNILHECVHMDIALSVTIAWLWYCFIKNILCYVIFMLMKIIHNNT